MPADTIPFDYKELSAVQTLTRFVETGGNPLAWTTDARPPELVHGTYIQFCFLDVNQSMHAATCP